MTTTVARQVPADVEVRRISGSIGAEVFGFDLRRDLEPDEVGRIRSLLLEHLVLFFPQQHLTPTQHRAFAAHFGELERPWNFPTVDEHHPEVAVLESDGRVVADVWHFDQSFHETPNTMGCLNAIDIPSAGGDTIWSNQYRNYERLSEPFQRLMDSLTAVHVATGDSSRTARHPAVIEHPETKRKVLYLSSHHVKEFVELAPEESRALLEHLALRAAQPEVSCRYRWQAGTVNLWDNRCTQHYAVHDFNERRLMHRVTITERAESPR